MTLYLDHIHIIGKHRQGQHTLVTSRSQGQIQGHKGHFRFLPFFSQKSISSYSFDRRVLKTHIYDLCDHTQKLQEAEF